MAFLISKNGLFFTAKHVLTLRGKIKNPKLFGVLYLENKKLQILNIKNILLHDSADIAIGYLIDIDPKNFEYHVESEIIHLSVVIPEEGEKVSTCSFTDNHNILYNINNLKLNNNIKWVYGIVRKYYPDGRDSYLLPGHCVETSITLKSGLSGGPVFNKNGYLIGVNSTSFSGYDKDISYFTPIIPVVNLPFEMESNGQKIITTIQKLSIV